MRALGFEPDPWQADVLASYEPRTLLLAARQVGKSRTTACVAVRDALLTPGATVLIVSPSERQSVEMLRKCAEVYNALKRPVAVVGEAQTRLEFANASRILALPASGETIRGYAVTTLVLDEAARIADALFDAVSPMLAVSGGRLIMLSSPCGKRGLFYTEWESGHPWKRVRVTADDCPRITREFLDGERERMTEEIFMQEYYTQFNESEGAVFSSADIAASVSGEVEPLVLGASL
jgi:hypothetical protein